MTGRALSMFLWALIPVVQAQSLTSSEPVVTSPGQSVSLSCKVTGLPLAWLHWIRQKPGRGLEWIGRIDSGTGTIFAQNVQGQFSITKDTSTSTVYLQFNSAKEGDTAVYYCARVYGSYGYDYFDYWGKGTTVTVTSATPTAPTVFPVMPCNSGTGTDVTLACLATGFSPSAVSFTWTKGDVALTDSIQYPPVLKDNLYSGVSQIRIPRNDWENRASYKCKVDHAAGNKEVNFIKPNVIYQLPNLTMMTSEENEQVTFSCLANNFAPNVFDFNWLKDSANINTDLAFTMPPKAVKTTKGTVYSAASFLTLPVSNVHSYDKFTCNFKLGKGQKQLTTNITQEYSPSDKCAGTTFEGSMTIIPPSVQDMLYYRTGKIRCEVNVAEPNKVISVSWTDEKLNVLMNNTDEGAEVRGQRFVLDLEITYNEWNSGIRRVCQLDHQDLLTDPLKKVYERKNDFSEQTPPSVFMLAPVKQTKDNKVTLTCYVKNFNPKEIYVTWLIDDKESKHDFNTTNSMKINGDYYAYSHLTVPLNEWEESEHVYSCLVYHEAIDENTNIVRSITQHTSQQTTMVNLNMKFPDMCKA